MKIFKPHGNNSWIKGRFKTKLILEALETLVGFFFFGFEASASMPSNLQLRFQLLEERPRGTVVCDLAKEIRDLRTNESETERRPRFRFLSEQSNAWFSVGSDSGIVETNVEIDRDHPALCRQKESCVLGADVVVVLPPNRFQIVKIVVDIVDLNDNSPTFGDPLVTMEINEAAPINGSYLLPTAVDYDGPMNGIDRYELANAPNEFSLGVEKKLDSSLDLKLILNVRLDRETVSGYRLLIVAVDAGSPARSGSLFVDVVVTDSNDNQPRFDSSRYEVAVPENKPPGSRIIALRATDPDSGVNGLVFYDFNSRTRNSYGSIFGIRNDTGEIHVKGPIDRESHPLFQLVVVARDSAPDPLSSEVTVVVKVEDVNDNAPQISFHTLNIQTTEEGEDEGGEHGPPRVEISEDASTGAFVAQVSVVDADSGINGQVNCTVIDRTFALVRKYRTEYQLELALPLDREQRDSYDVHLRCQDGAPLSRVSEKKLKVVVTDVNDNSPTFTQKMYRATIDENNLIGVSVLQVTATDSDAGMNSQLEYSIHNSVLSIFRVNEKGIISTLISLDRESQDSYNFLAYAVDCGVPRRSGSAVVLITVGDVNDEKPRFSRPSYRFTVAENRPPATQVGQLIVSDRDGPNFNEFYFSLVQHGAPSDHRPGQSTRPARYFAIDRDTGMISTTTSIDRETTSTFRLSAIVTDKNSPSLTDEASVVVDISDENDNDPEIVYPGPADNFVFISNESPPGHVVARIVARDADAESNGRLNFKILEDRTNQSRAYFRIDQNSGEIRVTSSLVEFDERVFPLAILVTDRGLPTRRASPALLRVHVNGSIPFASADRRMDGFDSSYFEDPNSNREWVPLYHVVISTAVFLGCLALVIFFLFLAKMLRRRDQRKHLQRGKFDSTAPSEALGMLSASEPVEGSPYKVITSAMGEAKMADDCVSPLLEIGQSEVVFKTRQKGALDVHFSRIPMEQQNACHQVPVMFSAKQKTSEVSEASRSKKFCQTSSILKHHHHHHQNHLQQHQQQLYQQHQQHQQQDSSKQDTPKKHQSGDCNSSHVSQNRERSFPPPPPPPRESPRGVRFSPSVTAGKSSLSNPKTSSKKLSFAPPPPKDDQIFPERIPAGPARTGPFPPRSFSFASNRPPSACPANVVCFDDSMNCRCPGHRRLHGNPQSSVSYSTLQTRKTQKKNSSSSSSSSFSTLKTEKQKNASPPCQGGSRALDGRPPKKVRIEESVKRFSVDENDDVDDDDVV